MGVFDGVHVGHRRILDELTLLAGGLGARSVVVTFEPHPVAVLKPGEKPLMLTTLREKLDLVRSAGCDEAVVLEFNPNLARREAEWFVEKVLLAKLNMVRLVIGYDFRFGRRRRGDAAYLEALGERLGFGVDIVPPVLSGGRPVSSTRIRRALSGGEVGSAGAMLGRPYCLSGKVVRGEGRGRRLTYPTANLAVAGTGKILPPGGVYAVKVRAKGRVHKGVLYIGTRPTYRGCAVSVEAHLIDWEGALYGRMMEACFVKRLRGERAFRNEASLRRAISRDVEGARAALDN